MSSARGRYYEWYINETTVWVQDWCKVQRNLLIAGSVDIQELPCYFVKI
jgi:hypothetical protein